MTQSGHGAAVGTYINLSIVVNRPGGDMQRRGGRGRPMKGRRTNRPKARKTPIRPVSPANLQDKLDQLTRELDDARERETATAEVLQIIRSSPRDLDAVFNAILENATHLCSAMDGGLFKFENGEIEPVALHNVPEALAKHLHSRGKIKPRPGSTMERIVTSKDVLHIEDILKDPDGTSNPASKYGGARTFRGTGTADGDV
jgi:hypothetical protein